MPPPLLHGVLPFRGKHYSKGGPVHATRQRGLREPRVACNPIASKVLNPTNLRLLRGREFKQAETFSTPAKHAPSPNAGGRGLMRTDVVGPPLRDTHTVEVG
jgi:hypothetical protein